MFSDQCFDRHLIYRHPNNFMEKRKNYIEESSLTPCSNINKVVSVVWRNSDISGCSIFVIAIRFHCENNILRVKRKFWQTWEG